MHTPLRTYAMHLRNALLMACLTLPWLNPFTATPTTAVIPLLVSWIASACLVLLVVDLPVLHQPMSRSSLVAMWVIGLACLTSLVLVPQEVDHALTVGLLAALLSIALMARVGMHVAWRGNGLMFWVALAWLVAAAVSSLLGVLQYLGWARELAPWVSQPPFGEAFANLRQRNQFATLTSIGLAAGLALLAARAQRAPLTPRVLALAVLLLNLLAMGVACSVSRTGALQWLLLGVLAALWAWRACRQQAGSQRALLVAALAAPCLVLLWSALMPWIAAYITGHPGMSVIQRIAGQAQDLGACGGRSVLWSNILVLIAQHPWLGWGWGELDYAHFMTAYSGMRFCDMPDNAHNLPLQLAMDFGIPLALVLLTCAVMWVWQRQPWREQDTWRSMAWGVLLVVGVHSLLEYPLWYGPFQMAVGLALGLLWCKPQSVPVELADLEQPSTVSQARVITLTALMFIGCLYAAWDFNRVAQVYRPIAQRDAAYRDDPISHANASWLFQNQAEFAELTMNTVNAENAQDVFFVAARVVHYSPEPRVVQRLIDSAKLLGQDELATTLTKLLDAQKNARP